MLYGVESGCFDDKALLVFNNCWNTVFRKIFGYFRWESVRNIMACLNKLNVDHLVYLRRILFIKKIYMNCIANGTLNEIVKVYINNNEFQSILTKFNISMLDSFGEIKSLFFSHFLTTCH